MVSAKRWLLFLSSYFPLYLLILIKGLLWVPQDGESYREYVVHQILNSEYFYIVLGLLMLLSLLTFAFVIASKANSRIEIAEHAEVENNTADVLAYFMTYLIPILSMDITSLSSVIINVVIFLIIGIMYVRGEIVHLNPLLVLAGYSLFDVDGITVISNLDGQGMREVLKRKSYSIPVRVLAPNVVVLKRSRKGAGEAAASGEA